MRPKAIFVATIAVFVASAATAATMLKSVDFSPYRTLIAQEVKSVTGRELVLGGEIRLVASLHPTIAVDNVTLANAPWGSRPQMAIVGRLEAELNLPSLLVGEIRFNRIAMIDADILLETDETGQRNWSLRRLAEGAREVVPEPNGASMAAFSTITEVQIRDATLTYRDGRSGTRHSVRIRGLSAKADSRSSPITVKLHGRVNAAPVRISGQVGPLHLLAAGASYPVALEGRVSGARFALRTQATKAGREPGFLLSLTGDDLTELEDLVGIPLPPRGPYSLTGILRRGPDTIRLGSIAARIAESDFSGDVTFAMGGKRPLVKVALKSPVLNLADLGLGPILATSSTSSESVDGRVFPADPLPLAWLRDIDAIIEVASERVRWRPLTFENVRIRAVLNNGRLAIEPLEVHWQGGSMAAAVQIDGRRSVPSLDGTVTGRHIVIGTLLRALGVAEGLSGGPTDFDVSLRGRGNNIRALLAGADGDLRVKVGPSRVNERFAKGALAESVGLIDIIEDRKEPNVRCMAGRFKIADGAAVSHGLVAETNSAVLMGEGRIDLKAETLDFRVEPRAKQVSLMSFGTPLIVGGTLAQPTVSPDATNVAVGAAAVVATGATGGLAGIVAALIAGGMAAIGTTADEDGEGRCTAIIADVEADADQGAKPQPAARPRRSNRDFR